MSGIDYGRVFYIAIALLLIALGGLSLLVIGLRGRRVGDEPRCGKCEYILLHLESRNCPECGTEITPASTVIGQRKRRVGLVVAGVTLLILPLLFL